MRSCLGWDGVGLGQDVFDVVEPPVVRLEEGTAFWAERGLVSEGQRGEGGGGGGKHEFGVRQDTGDVAIDNL